MTIRVVEHHAHLTSLIALIAAVTIGCGELEPTPDAVAATDTQATDATSTDTEDATADTGDEEDTNDAWVGGVCGPSIIETCPASSVCVYDTPGGCSGGVELGGCFQLPFVCDDEPDDPVMTCGGRVYRNRCEARADGHYSWLDPADPDIDCGSHTPDGCSEDAFCLKSLATTCNPVEYHGQCTPRPTSCPPADPDEQVMTCDYELYASECEARKAGYGGRLEPAPDE